MRIGLFGWLLGLIFCVQAHGATVLLTDGSVLKGTIVADADGQIIIRTVLGELLVDRALVKMLEEDQKVGEVNLETVLSEDYGETQDEIAVALIARAASEDTATVYRALDRDKKGPFLVRFWQAHNPMVLKYYFGYYLGQRHFTVSDAYFERGNLIPTLYRTRPPMPDPLMVDEAVRLCELAEELNPKDPVVLCALGYAKLEENAADEAEKLFLRALQQNRKFAEARNGRALALMKVPGRKDKAMQLANETVAMDRDYVAALYTRAMCHLARVGKDRVDMDHYLKKVIEKAPGHYDAHFKLGAFYESLRYLDKAAAAYSLQLQVNPAHETAPERLARVAMRRRAEGKTTYSFADLQELAQKDPQNHLPLLADALVKRGDWVSAEAAFKQYMDLIDGEEQLFYDDLSLLATPEEISELKTASGNKQRLLQRKFWIQHDPTPTSPANERWVEHCLRVYHARLNYSEGIKAWHGRGWDRRGDVYVRFGAPDHISWSDNLVFETDPKVAKVKNRLNNLASQALEEVQPTKHLHGSSDRSFGYGAEAETAEIRGRPTFPIPMRTSVMNDGSELGYKWESWIYANIGEGFEITFLDPTGEGMYDYAPIPPNSRYWTLWRQLAPETIVAQVTHKTPSIYAFDYGGEPLDLYLYTANFEGKEKKTDLEVYMGVPVSELEGAEQVHLDREVVVYDRDWQPVFHDSVRVAEKANTSTGALMVDQVRAPLPPGGHFVAVQVRDPVSRKVQVFKRELDIENFAPKVLALSDLELAGDVTETDAGGKFQKGDVRVIPMPSKTFVKGQPVYLYYEVYDLMRDAFGQTKYRVDYVLDGKDASSTGARILGGLGKLLGQVPSAGGVKISYEHTGEKEAESIYIALDVNAVAQSRIDLTVTVTDLNSEKAVTKKIGFFVVEPGPISHEQESE